MQLHPRCSCSSGPEEVQLQLLQPFSTQVRIADQTAASCSQDAVAAALSATSEVHLKLQLQLPQRTAAVTNCSCSCPKEL